MIGKYPGVPASSTEEKKVAEGQGVFGSYDDEIALNKCCRTNSLNQEP